MSEAYPGQFGDVLAIVLVTAVLLAASFLVFVPWFKRDCWRCGKSADYLTPLEAAVAWLFGRRRVICGRCWQEIVDGPKYLPKAQGGRAS